MAKEFGYKIRAFHHALEAYKVADKIAEPMASPLPLGRIGGVIKDEARDGIPWNAVISMHKGVRVAHEERLNGCAAA